MKAELKFMLKSLFKPIAVLLLAALPMMVFVSCAQKQELAGTWQEPGKKSTIEFHNDSTFNAIDDMGMAVSGKYILQKNGSIRFEITHEGSAPEIVEGKLSERGDEITFGSADDKKFEKYRRVK
jgi:hypothetical protein